MTNDFYITYPTGLFKDDYFCYPSCNITISTFGNSSTFYATTVYQKTGGTATKSPTYALLRFGGALTSVNFGFVFTAIGKWK